MGRDKMVRDKLRGIRTSPPGPSLGRSSSFLGPNISERHETTLLKREHTFDIHCILPQSLLTAKPTTIDATRDAIQRRRSRHIYTFTSATQHKNRKWNANKNDIKSTATITTMNLCTHPTTKAQRNHKALQKKQTKKENGSKAETVTSWL